MRGSRDPRKPRSLEGSAAAFVPAGYCCGGVLGVEGSVDDEDEDEEPWLDEFWPDESVLELSEPAPDLPAYSLLSR
jgi:hypothetical protein